MSAGPSSLARPWRLATFVLCWLTAVWCVQQSTPPTPSEKGDPAHFSARRAHDDLVRFVGDGVPRAVGSTGHDAAKERLLERLRELGVSPTMHRFFARGWNRTAVEMHNILVEIPGRDTTEAPLPMLWAHWDSVPSGPGAGDNGVGVACALECIRALIADPPARAVLVVFTDGEEVGLWGARRFAEEHPWWMRAGAIVNLDARGSSGPAILFETGADAAAHAHLIASLHAPVCSTSFAAEAYRLMPNNTDFTVAVRTGRPGFNIAFIGSPRNYHTANDRIDQVDIATIGQMGSTALALLRSLAAGSMPMPMQSDHAAWTRELGTAARHSAIWFNALGGPIIRWDGWISIVLLVLASFATVAVVRRCCDVSLGAILRDGLLLTTGLMLATSVGWIFSALSRWIAPDSFPWPTAFNAWVLIAVALGAVAAWTPRLIAWRLNVRHAIPGNAQHIRARTELWSTMIAANGLSILLAAIVLTVAPGAAYPLLLPAVAGSAVLLITRGRARLPDAAAGAAVLLAIAAWVPLEGTFHDAFGTALGILSCLRGALVALPGTVFILTLPSR
ncbi:MAG: M20/M25/M40 family metallo-hydrolase [Planctomycetes bacterium]|nr:M20/M25/M40 family metallo-hydrolase [Planctomycetota bacterium]